MSDLAKCQVSHGRSLFFRENSSFCRQIVNGHLSYQLDLCIKHGLTYFDSQGSLFNNAKNQVGEILAGTCLATCHVENIFGCIRAPSKLSKRLSYLLKVTDCFPLLVGRTLTI